MFLLWHRSKKQTNKQTLLEPFFFLECRRTQWYSNFQIQRQTATNRHDLRLRIILYYPTELSIPRGLERNHLMWAGAEQQAKTMWHNDPVPESVNLAQCLPSHHTMIYNRPQSNRQADPLFMNVSSIYNPECGQGEHSIYSHSNCFKYSQCMQSKYIAKYSEIHLLTLTCLV